MLTEKTGNMQMNSKLKSNVISNKAEVAVAVSAVWVVATGPLQREEVSAVTSTETKVNFPISSNPYSVNAGEAAKKFGWIQRAGLQCRIASFFTRCRRDPQTNPGSQR